MKYLIAHMGYWIRIKVTQLGSMEQKIGRIDLTILIILSLTLLLRQEIEFQFFSIATQPEAAFSLVAPSI